MLSFFDLHAMHVQSCFDIDFVALKSEICKDKITVSGRETETKCCNTGFMVGEEEAVDEELDEIDFSI